MLLNGSNIYVWKLYEITYYIKVLFKALSYTFTYIRMPGYLKI